MESYQPNETPKLAHRQVAFPVERDLYDEENLPETELTDALTLQVVAVSELGDRRLSENELTKIKADLRAVFRRFGLGVELATTYVGEADLDVARSSSLRKQLDMPLTELFTEVGTQAYSTRKIGNTLKEYGVLSMRDVLAMGRQRTFNMHEVGAATRKLLEDTLRTVDPRIKWRKNPTAIEMTRICASLDQVRVSVCTDFPLPLTVQDTLDMSRLELIEVFMRRQLDNGNADVVAATADADELMTQAKGFAQAFEAARARARKNVQERQG